MADKKVVTNIFQDEAGNKFDASTTIQGVVSQWGVDDVVSNINTSSVYEPVRDQEGKITSFRFFRPLFAETTNRKDNVEADRKGSVEGKAIKAREIIIPIDDEREVGPLYVDDWDADKLEHRVTQESQVNGSFTILPKVDRESRFMEQLRSSAKWAETNEKPKDKIDRIIDITTLKTDEEITRAFQKVINSLVKKKDGFAKGTNKAQLFIVTTADIVQAFSNTQAFSGSNQAAENLAKGSVGMLSGVAVYETVNSDDISYIGVRGAVAVPLANAKLVKYASRSDAWKGGFNYGTSTPTEGIKDKIFPERVVALGDPKMINAPIRENPADEPLKPTNGENLLTEPKDLQKEINDLKSTLEKQTEESEKLKNKLNQAQTTILSEKEKNDHLEQLLKEIEESEKLRMRAEEEEKRYHEEKLQENENEELTSEES